MEKDEQIKRIINTLTDEAEMRGLHRLDQIEKFVTNALTIRYGHNSRLNVSEIMALVFKNMRTGIRNLPEPDELHKDFKPPELDTDAINSKVVETGVALGKKYRSENVKPRLDKIYQDTKVALGLTDDTGMILRLSDEIDETVLAKTATMVGHIMEQDQSNNFEDDGLRKLYNTINEKVFPEMQE